MVALGQTMFKGSLYLASIGLSRWLTVDQFAAFGYFAATARFLSIFFAAGLTIAATQAFADASADSRDTEKTAAVVMLVVGAMLFAAAASPLYLPIVADEAIKLHGAWLIVGSAAYGAYVVALSAMFGASAFRNLLWPLAIGSAALLLGALVSIATGDLAPALLGFVLSFLTPALLFTRWLYRIGLLSLARPSAGAVKTVVYSALPTLATGIITNGVIWLVHRILLDNVASTAEFNRFVIGMQWFVLVLFVPNALGNALFTRFLHGAREGRLDVRMAAAVSMSIFAGIGLLALVAVVLTPALSALYGYEFDRWFVFAILAAAALAGPVTLLSYPIIAAFGVNLWFAVNLILLGTSVALLLYFSPSTALEAALILCGGHAAVLVLALGLLLRIPGRSAR